MTKKQEAQQEGQSLIDINVADTPDLVALEAGEYEVKVERAEIRTSQKTGGNFIMLLLSVPAEPNAKLINHIMMLPTQDDDERKAQNRRRAIKEACQAFDVEMTPPINVENFVGQSSFAILAEEEDAEYGTQNRVRRFVTPG